MVVNPAGLYGGGAFKVDTTPVLNYLAKQDAQEQARQKALDKYYQDQLNSVTKTGVRGQDQAVLAKAVENVKNFYIQNQSALSKGDINARMQFEQLMKVPTQIAAASRDAFTVEQKLDPIRIQKGQDFGKDWTTNTWTNYQKSANPVATVDATGNVIINPDYQPFDITRIEMKPKEVDLNSLWTKVGKDLNIQPDKTLVQSKPGKDRFTKIDVFRYSTSPDNARKIGNYADNLYNQDEVQYSFKKYLKGLNFDQYKVDQNTAAEYNRLNQVFRDVYGKDIDTDPTKITGDEERNLFIAMAMDQNRVNRMEESAPEIDQIAYGKYKSDQAMRQFKEKAKYLQQFKKDNPTVDLNDADKYATSFEDIGDGTYGAYTKKGGYWYDKSGNKVNTGDKFDIVIPKEKIPESLFEGVSEKGRRLISGIRLKITNGVVQAATDEDPDASFFPLKVRPEVLKSNLKGTGIRTRVRTMGGGQKKDDKNLGF